MDGPRRAGWTGAAVAAFLLAGGHRRFGFISGTEGASTSGERLEGYRQVLARAGTATPLIGHGAFDADRAAQAARDMLVLSDAPNAIFCANDHMAIAVRGVATQEFGRVLGRNLSVVGFDDTLAARMVLLTTFSQSAADLAAAAISMAHGLVENIPFDSRQTVTGELVVRSSARVPATGCRTRDGITTWSFAPSP